MSEPISPLRQWPAGIPQASPAANENALRLEAFLRPCLGVANDETGSDESGDVYIVGDSPTGAFAEFSENDIALFQFGSWYAWEPFTGARLVVNDVRMLFDGSDWIEDPAGGGADSYTIVTEGSPFTARPGTHDGLMRYNRAGDDITFSDSEPYTTGMVFNIRATSSIELIEDDVTLTPPAGGSLNLEPDMAVQVVFTSATTADVIGQTGLSS